MNQRLPTFQNNFLFLWSDSLREPLELISSHIADEPFGVLNSLFKYTYITRHRKREVRYETIHTSEGYGTVSNNHSLCVALFVYQPSKICSQE